jgi:sarcosine oxidase subunit gamma
VAAPDSVPGNVQPNAYPRRSFLYRKLAAAGANFGEVGGGAVALDFGDSDGEAQTARRLGLADLSVLPHSGFKGAGVVEWLRRQGVEVSEEPNWAPRQAGGGLALRQAAAEVMILGDLSGDGGWPERLKQAWWAEPVPPETPRGFPMPRDETHAWLAVTGEHAAAMFAKLCGVDLRPPAFPQGRVAQTSIARLNGVIVRDDRGGDRGDDQGGVPFFHLLADCAAAEYLWDCLLDAMAEFDGRPVGLTALRGLGAE